MLGLGSNAKPPCSKLIHWLFPNGRDNIDQRSPREPPPFISPGLLHDTFQALNQAWGWGGNALTYTLWGFWLLDSAVSYVIAFSMLYVM